MKVVANGIPMRFTVKERRRDMQEEVFKRFGKGKSVMNATDFYAGDRKFNLINEVNSHLQRHNFD